MAENMTHGVQPAEQMPPSPALRTPCHALKLFIGGVTPRSHQAITHLRQFCDRHLNAEYRLEVIDIYQSPERTREHQVVAVPTLIVHTAEAPRRIVGNVADTKRLLLGLGLDAKHHSKDSRL